jgi:hypothetical protein
LATITYLTTIEFDFGAVARLAELAAGLGIQRPLLVTDPGLAGGPIAARVRVILEPMHPVVFADTPQNPD